MWLMLVITVYKNLIAMVPIFLSLVLMALAMDSLMVIIVYLLIPLVISMWLMKIITVYKNLIAMVPIFLSLVLNDLVMGNFFILIILK